MVFASKPAHNASRSQPESPTKRLLREHKEVAISSWRRLWLTPFANLLTWLTLAIALTLPAGLLLLLSQAQHVGQQLNQNSQLSVFLAPYVSLEQGQSLALQLQSRPDITQVTYISAAQALVDFKASSGLADVLDSLTDNPLPATLLVEPTRATQTAQAMSQLAQQLRQQQQIDQVLVDMAWLDRLQAILTTSQSITYSLAVLLALGVLLVVGNTVRLQVESRKQEILVIKLVGGTDAYLRRPFLYAGFWAGLFASSLAWLIIQLGVSYLHGPLFDLAQSYQSDWQLEGLGWLASLALLTTGCGLSVLGASLTVGRQLRLIEPK
jgi:cell division transport system permease protein